MRKPYLIVYLLVVCFLPGISLAQCPYDNNFNGFPNPFSPTGPGAAGAITSTTSWAGDYLETTVTSGNTYTWTGCSSGSPFDAAFTLYQVSPLNLLAFNDNFCGTDPQITWTATFSGNVRLLIDLMPGCTNNSVHYPVTLSYTSPCNALSVTTQPGNANICPGDNASFTAAFSGDPPITYQWFFSTNGGSTWTPFANGGSNPTVSGAQATTLGLNSIPASYNGYLVRLEATNPCGSLSSSNASINTTDNQAPVFSNPGNQSGVVNASCVLNLPDFWSSLSIPVTDNCDPSPLTSQSPAPGSLITGANTSVSVTLTCTDASTNANNQSFTFTTQDLSPPNIICQNVTVFLDGAGNANLTPGDVYQSGSDNCGSVNLGSLIPSAFTCADVGNQSVTLSANDGFGNNATCSATVTVVDSTSPLITCPANISVGTDPGLCAAVVSYTVTTADNCGSANLSQMAGMGSGSTFPVGTTTESYTATDLSGNTANCSFSITVSDQEPPNAICQSQTVYLDINGLGTLTAAAVGSASTDNCQVSGLSLSRTSFACADLGSTTVSLIVSDNVALQDTCQALITLVDTVSPLAQCQNLNIALPASGDTTIQASALNNGSTDNCSLDSLWLSQRRFTCSDIGSNSVVLTVRDSEGNLSNCTATVTVNDNLGLTNRTVNLGADTTICGGGSLTLDGGANFSSWAWSTGGTGQFETVTSSGNVSVVATDSLGCTGTDTLQVNLHIVAAPVPRANGGPPILCLGDSLEIVLNPGYSSYLWSTGAVTPSIWVGMGGIYGVTVTDTSNCSRQDSLEILTVPFPGPDPQIEPGNQVTICEGGDVTLDARSGYFTYSWSTGATSQILTVTSPGTYILTVTNGFGCWDVDSVVVDTSNLPTPVIFVSGDSLLCNLTGSAYQWFVDGRAISLATHPYYIPSQSGSYQVIVYDNGGCESKSDVFAYVGLETAEWVELKVYPNPSTGKVWIEGDFPSLQPVSVDLYDLNGKRLQGWGWTQPLEKLELDLSPWQAGLYFVRISQGDRFLTRRILLQP